MRVEIESPGNYPAYYSRYNWHGDVESFVNPHGGGGDYRNLYGAWGYWRFPNQLTCNALPKHKG